MNYTVVYRGRTIGSVDLVPTELPPGPVNSGLSDRGEWHTGLLTVSAAYADVRPELRGLANEIAASAGATGEVIRERLLSWKQRYAENGLRLQDAAGQVVEAADLVVMDYGADGATGGTDPFVLLGALMPRPR